MLRMYLANKCFHFSLGFNISSEIDIWSFEINGAISSSRIKVSEEFKGLETAIDMKEDRTDEGIVARDAGNVGDVKPEIDATQLNLVKNYEELKSRPSIVDSKLREVDRGIIRPFGFEHTELTPLTNS